MINAWNEDKYVQEIIFVLFKMKQQFIIRFFWMFFFSSFIFKIYWIFKENDWRDLNDSISFFFLFLFSESYYFRNIAADLLIAKKKEKKIWKTIVLINGNGFRHGFCHSHSSVFFLICFLLNKHSVVGISSKQKNNFAIRYGTFNLNGVKIQRNISNKKKNTY